MIAKQARFDIAIAGGGPVGLALAGMLLARGVDARRITIIDAKTLSEITRDPRAIALSQGSRQLLEQIHAWPTAATAITQIHVSRRASFGRALIEADDYGLPALGYVCRYGDVVQALADHLSSTSIHQYRPARILNSHETDEGVSLELSDGSTLSANWLVQAEGGIFGEQQQRTMHRDYQQHAIISTVWASLPSPGRAFERFTEEGPLALLPLQEAYSLVWCVRPDKAEQLIALNDQQFLHALQQAFGQRVGQFTRIAPRASYVLGLNAQAASSARKVAIGNASQTLHPVAGQGLNLGLRDASVLAALLARDMSPESLTQFTAERQADRNTTIRLTDTMARVFASAPDRSLTQDLLGLSLGLIDVLPPAKRLLAEQMMFGWR